MKLIIESSKGIYVAQIEGLPGATQGASWSDLSMMLIDMFLLQMESIAEDTSDSAKELRNRLGEAIRFVNELNTTKRIPIEDKNGTKEN